MCFSNLPVEFDEDGNPYLAEGADDVERPGAEGHEHGHAGGDPGAGPADADLSADPEGAYEAIVASLPEKARKRVADDEQARRPRTDAAGGDRP